MHSLTPAWARAAALIIALLVSSESRATDGVLEINQACAVQTGCFAGDAAGFPVTITQSGSYRLTDNLSLSAAADPANTHGIVIGTSDVRIDLNGFSIRGITSCTGRPATSCGPMGSGVGIFADFTVFNVAIENGTVRGMGSYGVSLGQNPEPGDPNGENYLIDRVRASQNGSTGFVLGEGARVRDSAGNRNGGLGFFMGLGAVVTGCTALGNGGDGIQTSSGSTVSDNAAYENGGSGITVLRGSTVMGNSAARNGGTGIAGVGGGNTLTSNAAFDNGANGILLGGAGGGGSTATGNTVYGNATDGIFTGAAGGTNVVANTVKGNGGFGLKLATDDGYANNVVTGNTGGTVSGGYQVGSNGCNGNTVCP